MRTTMLETARQLKTFTRRQWLVSAAGAVAVSLLTGLPTDIVSNPFYVRMTPVPWWAYPVWATTGVLAGLVGATYVRRAPLDSTSAATAGGGLMSFFAIGCPVCNKLVVALMGAGGALGFFAAAQAYLALGGLALLSTSLVVRLRQSARCPAPAYSGPHFASPGGRGNG